MSTSINTENRLSCGSLRVHEPHDWLGTTSADLRPGYDYRVRVFTCPGNRCRSCGAPQGDWPVQDRLHKAGFTTCPACTRRDIQHDKDMERREDQ